MPRRAHIICTSACVTPKTLQSTLKLQDLKSCQSAQPRIQCLIDVCLLPIAPLRGMSSFSLSACHSQSLVVIVRHGTLCLCVCVFVCLYVCVCVCVCVCKLQASLFVGGRGDPLIWRGTHPLGDQSPVSLCRPAQETPRPAEHYQSIWLRARGAAEGRQEVDVACLLQKPSARASVRRTHADACPVQREVRQSGLRLGARFRIHQISNRLRPPGGSCWTGHRPPGLSGRPPGPRRAART